jgi:hypothetical protein
MLKGLGAAFLHDDGLHAGNITARLDDEGRLTHLCVSRGQVMAIEERAFQMTGQPPTADAMERKLDTSGHIALYGDFGLANRALKPGAAPVIAQIVTLMKKTPLLRSRPDGHTDSIAWPRRHHQAVGLGGRGRRRRWRQPLASHLD